MARLPISRVVDVTLTKLDRFATRRGFGTPLFVTSETTGPLNSTTRTKVYGSIDEVVVDFASTTEAYKMALAAFTQNPRPRQIKLGFVGAGAYAGTPSPTITSEMDALYAFDDDWYWLGFTAPFRDKPANVLDSLFAWVDAKPKLCIIASNDAATEVAATTTSVAARNKGLRQRSAVFYHTTSAEYPDAALIAYLARRDFDVAGSAYTAKFKKLLGISPSIRGSAAVQGATGFTPAIGLATVTGHYANMYVEIGGLPMVLEGTLLDGSFIDELHTADWLIARTEEELLSTLTNNDKIPFTNNGMHLLGAAVEACLGRAGSAGLIADDIDPDTGDIRYAYEIELPRVENVAASQRRQRIAPPIQARFRLSGAVHYAQANYVMAF